MSKKRFPKNLVFTNKVLNLILIALAVIALLIFFTVSLSESDSRIFISSNISDFSAQDSLLPDSQVSNTEKEQLSSIRAQAFIIWDENNKQIIAEKNSRQSLPIASITKVLTAIVAAKNIPHDHPVVITPADLMIEGDSGLLEGERWNRDELIGFMLSVSSNDGAAALGRVAQELQGKSVAQLMQDEAVVIGLRNYRFRNATGLDTIDGVESGNDASALDVTLLLRYFNQNYPGLAEISSRPHHTFQSNLKAHYAETTNQLASVLPHISAAKTGYTIVAGGNLTLVADLDLSRPVYFVVLGSTPEKRFSDMEILYNYAKNNILEL